MRRSSLLTLMGILSVVLALGWQVEATAGGPCLPPCIAEDVLGSGTVDLPAQCPFVNVNGQYHIIDGLPPGTTIDIDGTLHSFFNIQQFPGGSLGGGYALFEASLEMEMAGTGALAGYSRTVSLPIGQSPGTAWMEHAPRVPGSSPQSFASNMFRLQGQLFPGDPDFDLLRITAGADFSLPSPGHTTLTDQGGGYWEVEGFFDITYRIDFVGAPAGLLAGMSGSTTGTVRISNRGHNFWKPGDPYKMHFPQLPDPAGWDVYGGAPMVLGDDWMCSGSGPVKDIHFWGSWLNDDIGAVSSFDISIREDVPAGVDLPYSHPGAILWQRNIIDFCELTHSFPTPEGWYFPSSGQFLADNHFSLIQYDIELDSVDWFLQTAGTIYWLCISANANNPYWGWESTQDHFHDDAVWLQQNPPICPAPDNGTGTVDLPAQCPYVTVGGTFDIIDGLPPGTQINSHGSLMNFFNVVRTPGGPLGGELDDYEASLELVMTGTGMLSGYHRNIMIPIGGGGTAQMAHGPRTPGTPMQNFPSDMLRLSGQVIGDPDFDLLRITAGTDFGMPSPGHTTLTQLPGGNWNVDSFFDITYRIDFVGAPGGPLAGMSGSTTATVRIHQGGPLSGTWIEMYEPPAFTTSLDLAFVITDGSTAVPCDCKPGDANGDATIDISDAVYLIGYIFGGGPAPVPYPICSGDANCDCTVDISDAVYLIAYIFAGGSAPCDCNQWLINCGPPLR